MAPNIFRPRLKAHLSTVAPLAAALLVAAMIGLVPGGRIENAVMASGLPAVLPAAAPPLGVTARIAIMLFGGGVAATAVWSLLMLAALHRSSGRAIAMQDDVYEMVPQIRRADAHPDAPPRAPLRATLDLGNPAAEDEEAIFETVPVVAQASLIERDLPKDLDLPLSRFDPDALPDVPLAPQAPVRPLHRPSIEPVLADGERLETFELTPPVRRAAPSPMREDEFRITGPETEATVHALLERLERGVERRTRRREEPTVPNYAGLVGTLDQLRKLAVNG